MSHSTYHSTDKGLYILANDIVLDQLIALVNSVEQNVSPTLPICVVPYDDNTQQARQAMQAYPQVQWFDDIAILKKWETFVTKIWEAHPTAFSEWRKRGVMGVNRMGMHRRFCCFDGPFEKFIYLDADILAINSFDVIFDSLDDHAFVTYDYQYKDLSHVFSVDAPNLTDVFERDRLNTEIFCAGLFASKKGTFTEAMLSELLSSLYSGDADILYYHGPDQSILNYMVMKSGIDAINLSRTLSSEKRTGCCVTSPHFVEKDNILFDKGEQLTYLHYIGVSSRFFRQVCNRKNILFPYRDLFLHYRYLKEAKQPNLIGDPILYNQPILRKAQRIKRMMRQFVMTYQRRIPFLPKALRPIKKAVENKQQPVSSNLKNV